MVQPAEYRNNGEISEFTRIVRAIRKRFWYIAGFVALATMFATYIGTQQQPTYTASVQIVLEPKDNANSVNELVASSLSKDASAIETQIKLLRTDSHIKNVITALDLEERWAHRLDDDEEDDVADTGDTLINFFQWGIALANLTTDEEEAADPSGGPVLVDPAGVTDQLVVPDETKMDVLHDMFNSNYRVQQEGQSYVISIYYTSDDPVEAADIANGAADVFIETNRSEKLSVTDRTSQWTSKRADSLYQELEKLEKEITQFRNVNPVDVRQTTQGANGEVTFMTSELAAIRGELSAKIATLNLVKQTQSGKGNLRDIAEINTSVILQNLLGEQLSLLAKEAELSKTYGERHPLMVQHLDERQQLNIKIEQEIARIVASIENDVSILEARRTSLGQEITRLRREEVSKAKVTFQLQDLLRRAENTRELYRKVLQRSKEINEQQEIVEPDVRLVSRASVPRAPSSPGVKIFGVIGFCASSVLSIMLALVADLLDKRLRTPAQIKEEFGLETAALVPQLSKKVSAQRRLIEMPRSIYADSMRSIYMAIRQATPKAKESRVVLTTSSLPDEGKSTLSLSLATAIALQQKDVLIIDMDLRHPQIHNMTGHQLKNGVSEYCRDSSLGVSDCIFYDKTTGLNYLFVKNPPLDPSAIINSERFSLLMERLRQDFDLIVIDAAPVLAVTETRLLLSYVDLVTFCIRWGKTDIDTATEALNNIWSYETSPPILAVMTRVDKKKGAAYGLSSSRHRKAFKKYYQET